MKDLEPYIEYYKEFNLKNEALTYFAERLDKIWTNEENLNYLLS